MSIGSKPADKLVPYHCHNRHMQGRSWELQGMIQPWGLAQGSRHRDLLAGFCCHTCLVGNGMEELELGIERVKETSQMWEPQGMKIRMHSSSGQPLQEA